MGWEVKDREGDEEEAEEASWELEAAVGGVDCCFLGVKRTGSRAGSRWSVGIVTR